MNKEIKEILNYMKQYVENKYEHDSEPMLNYKDLQIILDYITNLEQENVRLKEYRESYRKELDYWRIQFSNKEEKINKAIEYIQDSNILAIYKIDFFIEDLLNILIGGNDNE